MLTLRGVVVQIIAMYYVCNGPDGMVGLNDANSQGGCCTDYCYVLSICKMDQMEWST